MAGILPIKIPYKLGQQPMQPMAGMPNMTLPPLKLPDIPLGQTSIFTSKPIIDVTKTLRDNELSSIFDSVVPEQNPTPLNPKHDIDQKSVITNTDIRRKKAKIKENLKEISFYESDIRSVLSNIDKSNIDIAEIICNNKYFLNNSYGIYFIERILKTLNKKNKEFVTWLSEHVELIDYFDMYSLPDILEKTNPKNIEFVKWLSENEIFMNKESAYCIPDILKQTDDKNIDLIKQLCSNEKIVKCINRYTIAPLIKNVNNQNFEFLKWLCENRNFLNKERVYCIPDILNKTDDKNIKYVKWLCGNKNIIKYLNRNNIMHFIENINTQYFESLKFIVENEKFLDNGRVYAIPEILKQTDDKNIELVKWLCGNEKIFKHFDRKNLEDTIFAAAVRPKNTNLLKWLCENEIFLNKENANCIPDILKITNNERIEYVKWLCGNEKILKYLDKSELLASIINTNNQNFELLKWLSENEIFLNKENANCIPDILGKTNADNIELAKFLCKDKKFTENNHIKRIAGILGETNAENIELAKIICKDEKFTNKDNISQISYILEKTNADNIELAKIICQDEKFIDNDNIWRIEFILKVTNANNIDFSKKFVQNKFIPVSIIVDIIANADYFKNYIDTDIFERIDNYKHKMLQNPELYINGEVSNSKEGIENFIESNYGKLVRAFDIFDKEAIDNLMRRRLDDAGEYLDIIYDLGKSELQLLKKMVNCNNMSGKPLLPAQKVECIDIIQTFKDNNILLSSVIEQAIVDNKIDLGKIKMILFKSILKNCGMKEEQIENMSKEKLLSWDLSYMHLLPKSMEEDEEAFIDLLKGANSDDFLEYIHDMDNDYGKTNEKTIKQFKELNMNYEKWVKPDKELETTFEVKDKNSERLSQLAASISDDIKELRENSAIKGFFDKQFKQYIEKDEFKIPQEIANSKANLIELINNIIEQLKPVWERAEKNKDNPQKQETARKTLTLISHLKTKLKSLQKMSDIKIEKPFDVRIKMWDRNPQKDLFQGNYSTCCIGMGECNGEAMPHYLMNTAFNMIELIDNNSGKTIGNALCYFAQDKKGTPIFVVDNIEINNSQKPSEKTGIQLRDKMFAYAKNVAKSVTGKDTEVIMSGSYNDVSLAGLSSGIKSLKLIGNIDSDEIYMDLFGGWIEGKEFEKVKYYGK